MVGKKILGLTVFILFLLLFTQAANWGENLPVFKPKVRSVAVFKNGLGYFTSSGTVTLKNGWAMTDRVPDPILGGLWIWPLTEGASIEEVIVFKDKVAKSIEVISLVELLKANVGKEVTITANNKEYSGVIKSVPEDREKTVVPVRSGYYPYYSVQSQKAIIPANLIILKTQDGLIALNKHNISKVEFPNNLNSKFKSMEEIKRFKLRVSSPNTKTKIGMSYLQKGITWVPSYLINIDKKNRARIIMKAVVVNDAEDLDNVEFSFVVGFPNFKYADNLSPMSLSEDVFTFLKQLYNPQQNANQMFFSGMSNVQSVMSYDGFSPGMPTYPNISSPGISGKFAEDLFFYKKTKISLKKGERGYYHIFSEDVYFKHFYKLDIPNTIQKSNYSYSYNQQKEKLPEQVWHCIKLTNTTKYPWTTAPAMVIKGSKPISQDRINYTPIGVQSTLKLTAANDIKIKYSEVELDRERNVKIYHYTYSLVTVQGEVQLKNTKNEAVDMEITKTLTGEVIEIDNDGKTTKTAEGLKTVNYHSILKWKITLKPKEEIKLNYKYKVHISR
ncbi:DUF4139 domain-containing protein [Candidatus Dependentiae bacterium]|nr:DUF4139 domain-containing protein [Candidatus Dependentiae bacterium]